MNYTILLVEQGLSPLKHCGEILEHCGFRIVKTKDRGMAPPITTEAVDLVLINTFSLSTDWANQAGMLFNSVRFQNLPFIFLGTNREENNKFDLGLKLVLVLPITPDLLITTIKNALEEKKRRDDWVHHGNNKQYNHYIGDNKANKPIY